MSLQEEIQRKKQNIQTGRYSLDIGAIISMYREGEIDLHPEFQRFFRWSNLQKSRFIESLLLGIPIPSIFVYQRDDGVWDVIDGVQRLSTIFEFVGILQDQNGKQHEPLRLLKTDYLPSLEHVVWSDEDDPEHGLTTTQRIEFKMVDLDFKIIREKSDPDAVYELFKRINTGGTPLSEQEVRNFLFVMSNQKFSEFLVDLSANETFHQCINIPDGIFPIQYDVELVCRFLALKQAIVQGIRGTADLSEFITNTLFDWSRKASFDENDKDAEDERANFIATYNLLFRAAEEQVFKRFDPNTKTFAGQFSLIAYDTIAVGVALNTKKWMKLKLTESSLTSLREKNLPELLLETLGNVIDQDINEKELLKAITNQLGQKLITPYNSLILTYTINEKNGIKIHAETIAEGVPTNIRTTLSYLYKQRKDVIYPDKASLFQTMSELIGEDEFKPYRSLIMASAQKDERLESRIQALWTDTRFIEIERTFQKLQEEQPLNKSLREAECAFQCVTLGKEWFSYEG